MAGQEGRRVHVYDFGRNASTKQAVARFAARVPGLHLFAFS
jgi:hypothetical protein